MQLYWRAVLVAGRRVDRYELICPIAEGATGSVWAARPFVSADRSELLAIKLVHARFAEDATFRRTFLADTRIATPLRHPNVAQLLDRGESDSLLYLTLEYVDGESLRALIEGSRTVPLAVALRIASNACAAVHAVHGLVGADGRQLVVHGDVSPSNLLLSAAGDVKLIGLDMIHARAGAFGAGKRDGTLSYTAPEQVRDEPVGAFTDVFGIGATLYRMLAGCAPYDDGGDGTLTKRSLVDREPPRQALPADVPLPVAAVLHRALAPRAEDRFPSVKEFGDALGALLDPNVDSAAVGAWGTANLSVATRERRTRLSAAAAPAAPSGGTAPSAGHAPLASPSPRASADAEPAPSFMDIGALAAKARHEPPLTPRADGAAASQPSSDASRAKASDAPPEKRGAQASKPARSRKALVFKAAIGVSVFVVVVLISLLVLPTVIKRQVIASAREAGFELTIDRVSIGFDGLSLRGIRAQMLRAPIITATIQEVHVPGISGKDARVLGLDARLTGAISELETHLQALLADHRARFSGTPTSPQHVSLVGARFTWTGPHGESLMAGDIGVDITSRGAGLEDIRARVGAFELTTKDTSFGPWASAFEQSPTTTRLRVMFDPPVPDGPSALLVWGAAIPTELTVHIPRSPFKNLGLNPAALGIPADEMTDVEAEVKAQLSPTVRSTATAKVDVWRARPPGFASPIDVHMNGAASAAPGKAFELERTTIAAGPLTVNVNGTLAVHERGLRLEATFKTLPVACEKIVRAEAKNMGKIVATLQALGQKTGALRVTGSVNAAGVVRVDTADLDQASLTWLAKETCGVSIFGM